MQNTTNTTTLSPSDPFYPGVVRQFMKFFNSEYRLDEDQGESMEITNIEHCTTPDGHDVYYIDFEVMSYYPDSDWGLEGVEMVSDGFGDGTCTLRADLDARAV